MEKERKYVFSALLAGLGAGLGMKSNQVFQFVAIGGIIGFAIDSMINIYQQQNHDIEK